MEAIQAAGTALQTAATAAARHAASAAARALPRPLHWSPDDALPVAGLDPVTAQSIHYALRHVGDLGDGGAGAASAVSAGAAAAAAAVDAAASSSAAAETAAAWLAALQLSQVAWDRLLSDLSSALRALGFWRARLRAGSHRSYMLLSRGPALFLADVLAAAGVGEPSAAAADQIQQRVRFFGGGTEGGERGMVGHECDR